MRQAVPHPRGERILRQEGRRCKILRVARGCTTIPGVGSPWAVVPSGALGMSCGRAVERCETACKPDPVTPRRGRQPFLWDRHRCRPRTTNPGGTAVRVITHLPYSIFLRVGFALPALSPGAAVRSYRTVSPLPPARAREAVCFLWHFPWPRGRLPLATTLTRGARTFLPPHGATSGCPAVSHRAPSLASSDRTVRGRTGHPLWTSMRGADQAA